jgi:hypothetical protein
MNSNNSPLFKISNDKNGIQFLNKITLEITDASSFIESGLEIKTSNGSDPSDYATIFCKDIITTSGISLNDKCFKNLKKELKLELNQDLQKEQDSFLAKLMNVLEEFKLKFIKCENDFLSYRQTVDVQLLELYSKCDELSENIYEIRDECLEFSSIQNDNDKDISTKIDEINTKVVDLRTELRSEFYSDFQIVQDELYDNKIHCDIIKHDIFKLQSIKSQGEYEYVKSQDFVDYKKNIDKTIDEIDESVLICKAGVELIEKGQDLIVKEVKEISVDSIDFIKDKLVDHECKLNKLSSANYDIKSLVESVDKVKFSNVATELQNFNTFNNFQKNIDENFSQTMESLQKLENLSKKMIIFDDDEL